MAVKFKVGFAISGETLFALLAKFLPIEDLEVEEIQPHAPRAVAKAEARIAQLSAPNAFKREMKRAPRPAKGVALNIAQGINGAIMAVLADGQPHRFRDLGASIAAAGFAKTGVGGKLNRLMAHGYVVKMGGGLWRLAREKKTA